QRLAVDLLHPGRRARSGSGGRHLQPVPHHPGRRIPVVEIYARRGPAGPRACYPGMTDASALADILLRLDQLEAEGAVRRVMAEYMHLCDALDADTPMDALGALFTADAIWEGKGTRYGVTFGRHAGRAAIVAMLDGYRGPVPH